MSRKPSRSQTPAAAYIRMSGRQQDKSPAEQRAEISKLAALLAGARAGKFTVVLAWHTNRISREDPMDAIGFYNKLRKAGVNLHTCAEGAIDLDDFTKQLLLFVNQEGSNDYPTSNLRLSCKPAAIPAPATRRAGRAITFRIF